MKKVYQIPKIEEERIVLNDIILVSILSTDIDIGDDPLKEIF